MQSARDRLVAFRRHWLTVAFFGGFLLDNITLNRVDQVFDNIVLFGYVLLASASLLLWYAALAERLPERVGPLAVRWMPFLVQFSFGGLLSGILVFYSRSGSWFASWPFLLLILGVILGNEFITRRAQRLAFNLVVLFIGIFSYAVLIVPVVVGKMGAEIFLASGAVAFVYFYAFALLLYRIIPNFIAVNIKMVIFSVGITYIMLNVLYFTNIIPPIPLSLKHIGIYHNVERISESTYRLTYEDGPWYYFWKSSDTTFHYRAGDKVYCYAAVFAPTRLSTTVFHRWEHRNKTTGEWESRTPLSYDITGGRGAGFRGFTYQESIEEGVWRCTVETGRGQVLGRETFRVVTGEVPGTLVTHEDR